MKYISKFLGIKIGVHRNESNNLMLKADYENQSALISPEELKIIEGKLPKKVTGIVIQWAFENRDEILENFKRLNSNEPLKKINSFV